MTTALLSGERQVAPDVTGIRRDHVARYEFAARVLEANSRVVDLACGVGYGSAMLADAGHRVVGIDRSSESIAYAREHYGRVRADFRCADASDVEGYRRNAFDAAVCFETIEHVEDPLPILKALRTAAPRLIASVPNEAVFPFRNHAFHFRHYTRAEFAALLAEAGWEPVEWHGQEGPHSEVEPDIEGRTLIVVAKRAKPSRARRKADRAATRPPIAPAIEAPRSLEHVVIVGLGPSSASYVDIVKRLGARHELADEVWAINGFGDILQCDRIFHMDDIRIQEARAAAKPGTNIANMLKWLRKHPGPIYTSRPHPDYPGLVPFPLEDVINNLGDCYFNSTAAYAVALAIHLGVKRLSLFGLDYTYANSHQAEKGRGCVEFWLGVAHARGIRITLPSETSLMDACEPEREKLYGYDTLDVLLEELPDGRCRVSMAERADPPTAEEIEARYDHRKPTVSSALLAQA